MPLEAGTKVGRYTIQRLLAQGGMAEVYRADQELTSGISRQVAVKLIRPEYSESQDFREMFLDEARTACTLSHPNIVHIYEVGETEDGQLYMAMELVSGETLATINRTLRNNSERFADDALFAIGIWTAGALEAVHALKVEGGHANLVHRDVSPHNLLLSSTGALKLIDFGIAKAATNRNLTMPGVTKGKAGYFSPEQAMGKKLDGRSDLFSLGVSLYKLASGETPFDDYKNHAERHAALVRGQWKRLIEVCPGLPAGFYEVVDRALMLKPEARFQTAREMRETLEKAAFDAGLRVSQSTLLGYVDDDGDITATGGSRSSLLPVIAAPPAATKPAPSLKSSPQVPAPSGRALATPAANIETTEPLGAALPELPKKKPGHQTEKISRPPRPPSSNPRSRTPLMVAAFGAAVVIGVLGTLLLVDSEPTPLPDNLGPEPVLEKPPAVAEVKLPPPVKPPPTPTPEVTVRDGEELVKVDVPKEPPKPPPTPVKEPVKVKAPKTVAVVKPPPVEKPPPSPPAPKEEAIPPGEGKLRINVSAPSAKILVGNEDWGEPPVNRRVNSGVYRVTVKLPDGSSSTSRASVWPDQTTTVMFDASSQKWSSSSR
ncbi:MAG: serine/threonine-protein kinase [Myxococcota bacterium]